MTVKVTIKPGGEVFLRGLRERTTRELAPKTVRCIKIIQEDVRKEVRAFAENPTGKLEKSFRISVLRTSSGQASARLTSDHPGAGIHETGGIITPKRASALTIPVTPQARALGARFWAKGSLFKVGSVLASRGGRGSIIVHFILKKSVRIRPKRYITKAMKRSRGRIERFLQQTHRVSVENIAARSRV